jgi:hypothetical protein
MPIEFSGIIIPFNQHRLLVYGPDAEALGAPLFGPPVYLRPGYWSLRHNDYLLPTEVIDDIGQRFDAPECYEWIEARGDAFPRADAIGVLASGEKQSVFMKELDLAVMAAFAVAAFAVADPRSEAEGTSSLEGSSPVRLDLAIEALAIPDSYALTPTPLPAPIAWLDRALPCYRLAPGVFGAVGAAILNQILANPQRPLHPKKPLGCVFAEKSSDGLRHSRYYINQQEPDSRQARSTTSKWRVPPNPFPYSRCSVLIGVETFLLARHQC